MKCICPCFLRVPIIGSNFSFLSNISEILRETHKKKGSMILPTWAPGKIPQTSPNPHNSKEIPKQKGW